MKSSYLLIKVCFALTLVSASLLLHQNRQAQPLQIQDRSAASSVLLTAWRDRSLFPAQCVFVTWQLEGIRAVYLNTHGKVGIGAEESCTVGKPPTFKVVLQDGQTVDYTLPVIQSYSEPVGFLTLAAFVVGLAVLSGLLIGPRALLLVLTVVVFGPLLRAQVNLGQDYIDHDMFATIALEDARALPPHLLYHVTAIVLFESHLVPNIENAGFLVMVLAYAGTALATYQLLLWLNRRNQQSQAVSGHVWTAATLALMLLGPISILRDTLNPGQLNALLFANTYHNPTVSLLKPLAILLFLAILSMIVSRQRRLIPLAVAAASLTALATLAKPSYTIAIVPAVALVITYSLLKPLRIPRIWLGTAILVPAAIVLIWQYMFLYGPQRASYFHGANGSIVFAPFDFFITMNQVSLDWLLLDLVASILFPALLYILYWRETHHNLPLNLSWLVFLITLAQGYFFNEIPERSHGNLTWGTQIGLFILFAVSLEFLINKALTTVRNHERMNCQIMANSVVLLAHIINRVGVLISA